MTLWSLVLAVHILAVVSWVGGLAFLLLVLRPSLAGLNPAERLGLLGEVFGRFFGLVWVLMPLTLLTGWAMVFGVYGGMAALPWPVNLMQLLGIIMAVIFLVVVFGPFRRFKAQPGPAPVAAIRKLMHVNVGLGAIVIVAACFAHWG